MGLDRALHRSEDPGAAPHREAPSSAGGAHDAERDDARFRRRAAEYVQLRVASRNLRSAGADPARLAPSDARVIFRPRIVGGTTAGAADNPFQVGLLIKSNSNNAAAQFCGGTLVRPNVVVTAAHCSDFVQADQVQVLTGTRRLDGTGDRRDVSQIAIHPSWNPGTFDNDVAVWRLASDATGVPLATLATEDGPVGANLLVTGWGALTEGGTSPWICEDASAVIS